MNLKIIIFGLVLFSCEKEAKFLPKKEPEWRPVKYHFDTTLNSILLADLYTTRIWKSKVKTVWIYTKTGSSIMKYIDTNNVDFPENILPMPDALMGDGKKK